MTDEEIEEQLAICEAATPGPWIEGELHRMFTNERARVCRSGGFGSGHCEDDYKDARFIEAARTHYPEALRELRAARAAVKEETKAKLGWRHKAENRADDLTAATRTEDGV